VDIVYTEAAREASADQSLADALAAVPTSILPVLLEGGIGRSASDNLPLPLGAGRLVSATSVWLGFLVAAVLLPVLLGLYSRAPPQWSLFVNRFLEREQALLDPHVPTAEDSDQRALVNFFEHAVRHLPIVGWRFSALGSDYAGGEPISVWPN